VQANVPNAALLAVAALSFAGSEAFTALIAFLALVERTCKVII